MYLNKEIKIKLKVNIEGTDINNNVLSYQYVKFDRALTFNHTEGVDKNKKEQYNR